MPYRALAQNLYIRHILILITVVLHCLLGTRVFAEDALKVAFLYNNSAKEIGWGSSHDDARKQLEVYFGDRIDVTVVEGVKEGVDAERVLNGLVRKGNKLIFATSFGYMNPVIKTAKRYPDVKFEHVSGYKRSRNIAVYNAREYEGRYLNGIAAGTMSKSGMLGFVGGFPIPTTIRDINAFALGIQRVNPDAMVKVTWINNWNDPGKERDASEVLIAMGVDTLVYNTASTAVVSAAEINGKYAFGLGADLYNQGPNSHISATEYNWFPMYRDSVQAVLDGSWKSQTRWEGLAEDAIRLSPMRLKETPEGLEARIEVEKAALISAENHIFNGPIYDNKGQLRVKEGETLSDEALLSIDWYVKGVDANN